MIGAMEAKHIPASRANTTSGTSGVPMMSAPHRWYILISDGVSKRGPSTQMKVPPSCARPNTLRVAATSDRRISGQNGSVMSTRTHD